MTRKDEGAICLLFYVAAGSDVHLSEDRLACVMEAVIDQYADGMFVGHAFKIWRLDPITLNRCKQTNTSCHACRSAVIASS